MGLLPHHELPQAGETHAAATVYPDLLSAEAALRSTPEFLALRDRVLFETVVAIDAYQNGDNRWRGFAELEDNGDTQTVAARGLKKTLARKPGQDDRDEGDPRWRRTGVTIAMQGGYSELGRRDDSQVWLSFRAYRALPEPDVLVRGSDGGAVRRQSLSYGASIGREVAEFMTAFGYSQVKVPNSSYESPDVDANTHSSGILFALTPLPEGSRYDFFAASEDAPERRAAKPERFTEFLMVPFAALGQNVQRHHAEILAIENRVSGAEADDAGYLREITDEHRLERVAAMHRQPDFRKLADAALFQVSEAISAYEVGQPYAGGVPALAPLSPPEVVSRHRRLLQRNRRTAEVPEPPADVQGRINVALVSAEDGNGNPVPDKQWLNVRAIGTLPRQLVSYYNYAYGEEGTWPFAYSDGIQQELVEYMAERGYRQLHPTVPHQQFEGRKVAVYEHIGSGRGIVFSLEKELEDE